MSTWTAIRDSERTDKGYYLEVDLEIPSELHDYMRDYPIAPERMIVTDNMLSPYSRRVMTFTMRILGST
jgi:hypothetical protein